MTDIRIGDRFKIEVEVINRGPDVNQWRCCISNSHAQIVYLSPFTLLASERIERPIAVGDRVRSLFGPGTGKVLVIDGDRSGVKWDGGAYGWPLITTIALGVSMEDGE